MWLQRITSHPDKTKLPDGAATASGCIFCDSQFSGLVEQSVARRSHPAFRANNRGGRRGGRRGRGGKKRGRHQQ
ncbi:Uncharacterised protein g11088 [Pycnogonum litorale]